jgi:TorA maturation chaperone TorD
MSMSSSQPIKFESADRGEETARADLYGLLATLYAAPPSQDLIDTIASARSEGEGVLEQAWAGLVAACREANAESLRDEYESLFIGVGKPEVMLYGSYYLSGFLMEKPLAALRTNLAELGLERDASVTESEDHIAMLCEVMRYLIASNEIAPVGIAGQKRFFATHLQPWVMPLCEAIAAHPDARFYRVVTVLAQTFFEVEMQAFDMS